MLRARRRQAEARRRRISQPEGGAAGGESELSLQSSLTSLLRGVGVGGPHQLPPSAVCGHLGVRDVRQPFPFLFMCTQNSGLQELSLASAYGGKRV